jgi:hypothetical protein
MDYQSKGCTLLLCNLVAFAATLPAADPPETLPVPRFEAVAVSAPFPADDQPEPSEPEWHTIAVVAAVTGAGGAPQPMVPRSPQPRRLVYPPHISRSAQRRAFSPPL